MRARSVLQNHADLSYKVTAKVGYWKEAKKKRGQPYFKNNYFKFQASHKTFSARCETVKLYA